MCVNGIYSGCYRISEDAEGDAFALWSAIKREYWAIARIADSRVSICERIAVKNVSKFFVFSIDKQDRCLYYKHSELKCFLFEDDSLTIMCIVTCC